MNILDKYYPKENSENYQKDSICTMRDFRKHQYELIPKLIKVSIDYLNKISNNYVRLKNIRKNQILKYLDAFGYALDKIQVNIDNPDNTEESQLLMAFNVPRLIKDNYFYLNGSTYVPCVYIFDKPMVFKKSSIKLYSLINPITIYFKEGSTRAIFGGRNIPLEYFLQWFLKDNDDLLTEVEDVFKLNKTRYSESKIVNYFTTKLFKCSEDQIDLYFHNLFFDEYTSKLYKRSYGIDFSFPDLIQESLRRYISNGQINFIDLQSKRLVFSELLLFPFFKRISESAFNFLNGQKFSAISFNENSIINYFMSDLKHQLFYDICNLYSGIMTHKVSQLQPNTKQPPSNISAIHSSHFKRICPITISAQRAGEIVSIVPTTKIDKTFGVFI